MPTLPVPTGVRSPGWRSDLGLHAALGVLESLDVGWRCTLPSVPDNPFGNVLVLRGAPDGHSPKSVETSFEQHFGAHDVPQLCVGWDDPEADPATLAPFVDQGFQAIDDVALALDGLAVEPGRAPPPGLAFRVLDLRDDLDAVLACELAVDQARAGPYGADALERNLAWSRAVIAGIGDGEVGRWYGAVLDGRIVATLGIVSVGGEGRLQSVGTRPTYRGRGIGGALVAWAWRDACARFEVDRVMLVTSRGGASERFYRRMGFRRIGGSLGVVRGR